MGPQLHQIYNDAYNQSYGDKHPASYGQPASAFWPEIWEFLEPAIEQVRITQEPLTFHDSLLPLVKHGEHEACWFDFSCSAMPGSDGQTLGVVAIAV